MPTDEKMKQDLEKVKEEADKIAQQQVLYNYTFVPSFVLEDESAYKTNNAESAAEASESNVVDVESVEKENSVGQEGEGNQGDADIDADASHNEVEADEKEQYIAEVANNNFQSFLASERASIDSAIETIKKAHPKDYDKYVEGLRKTKYYQKCLDKWRKYYADKKAEFENEAKEEAAAIENQAKLDALYSQKVENVENNNINKPQVVKTKPNAMQKEEEESSYKVNLSNLKLDPDLYKTVEQILVQNLRTAFDQYRDYYNRVLNKMNKDMKDRPQESTIALKDAMETRLGLLKALVNSFDGVFQVPGKTNYPFFKSDSTAKQSNVAALHENTELEGVADTIMCSLYKYDTKAKKNTGVIVDLAKHMTLKIQEQLIKKGKFGNFNVYKGEVEKGLSQLVSDYGVANRVKMINDESSIVENLLQELVKLNSKVTKDIKKGTNTVTKEYLSEYIFGLQYADFAFDKEKNEVVELLASQAEKLSEIVELNGKFEKKELLKQLANQEQILSAQQDNFKAIKKDMEHYDSKTKGARPIIDKLLMDITEKVGAESKKGKLNEFTISTEEQNNETNKLISFVDNNEEEIIFSEDLLNDIFIAKHDLREKFKGKHASKSQEAQSDADLLNQVLNDEEKDLTNFINSKIDESIQNKPEGKARQKHVVVENEGSYIK